MTPKIIEKNEKIKIGMFVSILCILIFMLTAYLAYFFNTEQQRVLREDSVSLTYIAIASFITVTSVIVGIKAILSTYRNIMALSN